MRTKVFYSGNDNLKKLAVYISTQLRQQSEQLPPAYLPENMPIVFVGTGTKFGGGPTKDAVEFVRALDPKRAQRVALFSVASNDKAINALKALAEERGVKVMEQTLVVKGKLNAEISAKADQFVKEIEDIIENRK